MGRATVSGEPASNKRDVILAAAVDCFAAHGLAGTGMRDIARAAGLTEGTLYHYFPSKDALIEEAFRWSAFQASDLRRAMQRRDALRGRLLGVGSEFLATLRRNPQWTRVVIREALLATPDRDGNPVRGALIALAVERIRTLTAALRGEMSSGRIARRDPRRVAEHLFHALIGHFVAQAIAGTSVAPAEGADPFLIHLVDTIARDLERGTLRSASLGRRRTGGRAP